MLPESAQTSSTRTRPSAGCRTRPFRWGWCAVLPEPQTVTPTPQIQNSTTTASNPKPQTLNTRLQPPNPELYAVSPHPQQGGADLAENLATVGADFQHEDAAVSRARVEVQTPPFPANHHPMQPTAALSSQVPHYPEPVYLAEKLAMLWGVRPCRESCHCRRGLRGRGRGRQPCPRRGAFARPSPAQVTPRVPAGSEFEVFLMSEVPLCCFL